MTKASPRPGAPRDDGAAQLGRGPQRSVASFDSVRDGEPDSPVAAALKTERNPQEPDQLFRVYIEQMQEGAVTVAPDAIVLYCNRRFAEMVERPLEKVIGSRITEYVPATAWQRISRVMAGADSTVKHESTLVGSAGPRLSVNLTASRLRCEEQDLMCLVVTDLTQQRERENLRMAKEVAERSNSAKDDFLAALSHELRTPLTPALMAATALEKDPSLPETVRSDITLIRRNVEFQARLIDDLLDLTLINRGQLVLQEEELTIHPILNRAVENCQADAREKRLDLQIELGAEKTEIIGDAVRLQQAFWNVLRNAVKFTPAGGRIAIATGSDAGQVWLRVTDSGVGFSREQAERLFEPFEQAGRGPTQPGGGLGIGLAITRSILQAHQGRIIAESPGIGQGAIFLLELPLRHKRRPVRSAAERNLPPARVPSMRILLVEDHKDTRDCIKQLLESARHQVTAAGTARSALEAAAQAEFDLVISDLGLPDLTGYELMRALRERFRLPGIALSGYGMDEDVALSHEAGFTHHLTKPISFDQLKTLVAKFASSRQ